MERTMRTLGGLGLMIPRNVLESHDWDADAERLENWDGSAIVGESNMTMDEYRDAEEAARLARMGMWAAEERDRLEAEARRINERAKSAGIPDKFRTVPINLTYVESLEQYGGLYIYGTRGSGKTWTAASTLKGWLKGHKGRAVFTTSVGMLLDVNSTYSSNESTSEVVDKYATCALLVLDDVGKENMTPNNAMTLWYVINERYANELPTIMTSQHKVSELAQLYSTKCDTETATSIGSRIRETYATVDLGSFDRRSGKNASR